MCSLVISIFLYASESWTLTAELEKRTQAFEMRCYRRLLNISYKDHVTDEEVRQKCPIDSSTKTVESRASWKGLLRSHLWCLNDLARLWDRLD